MPFMTPPESKPKRRRPYRKSGFHSSATALSTRGLSALDGRSAEARSLRDWKAQIAADLGDDLSGQELTLLDAAALDMALLALADAWLQENAAVVINKRKRCFVPLVAERLRVASHLAELLSKLGLKRRAKPTQDLQTYLAERSARLAKEAAEAETKEAEPTPAPEPPAAPPPDAPESPGSEATPLPIEEPVIELSTPESRLLAGWRPKPEPPIEPDEGAGAEIEGEEP